MLRKAQDINLIQLQNFGKMAEMKLPKDQCQRQIESLYNYFRDLRIKQRFINELKLYIQLKSMSTQELKAIRIDFEQYKSLLVNKSQLIHKICIKKEATPINKELFLRNSFSMKPFERFLNNQAFSKPYEYPLQYLKKALHQITTSSASYEHQQIQSKIVRKLEQNEQIIKRIQVIKNSVQQKHNQLHRRAEKISQPKQKPYEKTNPNFDPLDIKISTNINVQQLIEKEKRCYQIISNKQCKQQTELKEKLEKMKQKKLGLKDSYSTFTQKQKTLHFNVDKYLKKQTIIPRMKSSSQYKRKEEAQLKDLKQKYLLIQEKKPIIRQKQVNL